MSVMMCGEEETAVQFERLVAGGEEVPPAYA
jgi:hypothetical protein